MDSLQKPIDAHGTANGTSSKPDDTIFHPSPATSIGVEIELQIIDRDTGDLAPGAVRILKACEEEKIDGVGAELMQSMIEVKTGVCNSVDEVRDQLLARTAQGLQHRQFARLRIGDGEHASFIAPPPAPSIPMSAMSESAIGLRG